MNPRAIPLIGPLVRDAKLDNQLLHKHKLAVSEFLQRAPLEQSTLILDGPGIVGYVPKNLIRACFLTASLVARMSRHSSWQRLFSRVSLRLKKAPRDLYNWLYRGADACSDLLKKYLNLLLTANETIFHRRKTECLYQRSLFPADINL